MFSVTVTPAVVVLHTGHSLTLDEYLLRVLVYLLAFACAGVVLYWGGKLVGSVHAAVSRWEINENES